MASIVVSGDTSGAVTITAPAIAGTTTLTLPTTSGTIVTTGGAASLTTSGNLTFTGTGNRITGDFSNATQSNRTMFQSSTTNGGTFIASLPNGTSTGAGFLAFGSSDPNNSSYIGLLNYGGSTYTAIDSGKTGTGTALPLTMYTSGSERLRIDSSGNVGIGTTTAQSALDVGVGSASAPTYKGHVRLNGGGLAANGGLEFMNTTFGSGYGWRLQTPDEGGGSTPIVFQARSNTAAWTERMRIDSSGNVLVGTTALATGFSGFAQIEASGSSGGIVINSTAGNICRLMFTKGNATGNEGLIRYDTSNYSMQFWTDALERMRITSGGVLLVNQTTDDAHQICVRYDGSTNGGIRLTTPATSARAIQFVYDNAGSFSQVGSVTVTTTATAYNTSSDYRLKENIAPMTGALAKVAQLKPVTYNWKVDGSAGQGFIAHELQAVVPDCVTGDKDAVDKDGNPVYQGVDTSFLVATLTAAIQEQQAMIEELKARIETLEAK